MGNKTGNKSKNAEMKKLGINELGEVSGGKTSTDIFKKNQGLARTVVAYGSPEYFKQQEKPKKEQQAKKEKEKTNGGQDTPNLK